MAISKISANMIDGSMTSSLVTGTLPAVSGAALLNAGAGIDTETTTDPLITSNPAGGVGTLWLNTTSGELFNCQVATTNNNVWVNIGTGSHGVGKCFGGQGGGTVSGFHAGGNLLSVIQKYSFTSDGNAVSHGNISSNGGGTYMPGSASSATHGYNISGVQAPSNAQTTKIEKYAFASAGGSSAPAGLVVSQASQDQSGHSSSTHGYRAGGIAPAPVGTVNILDKFSFSSDGAAVDHGDLTRASYDHAGMSSFTHGYCAGGTPSSNNLIIDKFSFASASNATDHGDLLSTFHSRRGGHSSNEYGFISGGDPSTNTVETFSFASNSVATDHCNLSVARVAHGATSSVTHGYASGGAPRDVNTGSVIDKFAFVSPSATASDVGDLTNYYDTFGGGSHQT
jgi:hypothetical protein